MVITIIYRLHPSAQRVPEWVQRIQSECGNVQISQGVPLLEDLKRSTVALGLFSGALTVAAACGVPTFLLWEDGWFYTPDLECYEEVFVDRTEAAGQITAAVVWRQHYTLWQTRSICASEQYYRGRKECSFEGVFS
ncbi:MAG: hypothetical protein KatS3mg022_3231 [Armatimonadota bacterium]|nr:MAG: hypothetical protein KatS3mg022_3231 [Armatimonadota bacterium]